MSPFLPEKCITSKHLGVGTSSNKNRTRSLRIPCQRDISSAVDTAGGAETHCVPVNQQNLLTENAGVLSRASRTSSRMRLASSLAAKQPTPSRVAMTRSTHAALKPVDGKLTKLHRRVFGGPSVSLSHATLHETSAASDPVLIIYDRRECHCTQVEGALS